MFHPYVNLRHAIPPPNANALAQAWAADWTLGGKRLVDDRSLTRAQLEAMRKRGSKQVWPITADATLVVPANNSATADLVEVPSGMFAECFHYTVFLIGGGSFEADVSWTWLVSGRPIVAASHFYAFEERQQQYLLSGTETLQLRATNSGGTEQSIRFNVRLSLKLTTTIDA